MNKILWKLSMYVLFFNVKIQIYDELAKTALADKLMASSATGYFFKIILLYLLFKDDTEANAMLSNACDEDMYFNGSKEAEFCKSIIEAAKGYNATQFQEAW